MDILAAAEAIIEAKQLDDERVARAQIHACLGRSPRIVWHVSAQVAGGPQELVPVLYLQPRRAVSATLLERALRGLPQATTTWTWAWTHTASMVIALLRYPDNQSVALTFGLPRWWGVLSDVSHYSTSGVIGLTTRSPEQLDDVVLWTVDREQVRVKLAAALGMEMGGVSSL